MTRRFDLRNENHRYYLTDGLPPPDTLPDGTIRCGLCGRNVPARLYDTHVKGAFPVRMADIHHCARR